MKTYTHWLKIDHRAPRSDLARQYKEIEKYLEVHPESTARVYYYDFELLSRAVKLVCNESYQDLDMAVNSGFNGLRRLTRKPKNISISILPSFKTPEWLAGSAS